jgi:hypothetical protein
MVKFAVACECVWAKHNLTNRNVSDLLQRFSDKMQILVYINKWMPQTDNNGHHSLSLIMCLYIL